ncbi:MAG TPA: hypothetical protein VFY99_03570 [Solirubrobacterales bacterium]
MGWISISNTRLAGGLSLLALILISISDFTWTEFWDENAMATSIVADVLVLIVGVAVVNEFLSARARRRWQLVAEYGLIELSRSCRHLWIGLAELIGVGSRSALTRDEMREAVRDHAKTGELVRLAEQAVATPEQRRDLRAVVAEEAANSRRTLTGWAPVLVESAHSEALGRFAEMQALVTRLDLVLELEAAGKRPSSGEAPDPAWIARRIVTIVQLGSELAPELWKSAERIQDREERELSAIRAGREPGSGASAGAG